MKSALELDAGQRAYWRDQQRKAAKDWAAFDAAMAEMGKGTGAWTAGKGGAA